MPKVLSNIIHHARMAIGKAVSPNAALDIRGGVSINDSAIAATDPGAGSLLVSGDVSASFVGAYEVSATDITCGHVYAWQSVSTTEIVGTTLNVNSIACQSLSLNGVAIAQSQSRKIAVCSTHYESAPGANGIDRGFRHLAGSGGAMLEFGGTVPTGRVGIASLETFTSNTGRCASRTSLTAYAMHTGVQILHESDLRLETLSDAAERFIVRSGLWDADAADGTDGAFFRYSDNDNSGRWLCHVRNNSVATTVDSGVTVNTTDWYFLQIDATPTQVIFKINETVVATITTNIPNGGDRSFGAGIVIQKTTGATNRRLLIDRQFCQYTMP